MEILIVLLVFVLPVLSVILDDRKKKNIAATAVPAPAAAPGPIRKTDTYDPAARAGLTDPGARRPDAKAASAGHMDSARSTKSRAPEEGRPQPEGKRTFSEKQKLIIYSEILKPKFDS